MGNCDINIYVSKKKKGTIKKDSFINKIDGKILKDVFEVMGERRTN